MAFISATPVSVSGAPAASKCTLRMSASSNSNNKQNEPVSRRTVLLTSLAVAGAALLPTSEAKANREYAGVGYLGGSETIDVNNANVRAYLKIQGFYPTLAGLIVSNGPYGTTDDLYKIKGLTDGQKDLLKANEERLVALPPAPEYEIDKLNNGLYR